jgi:hypothetical protein
MKTDDVFEKIEVPAGLESKLAALIDRLANKEEQSKKKTRYIRLWTFSAAAGIALLLSVGWFFHPNTGARLLVVDRPAASMEDPEKAYEEAQKALALVSMNFNKGMNQLALATSEIEKSNKILNNTLTIIH